MNNDIQDKSTSETKSKLQGLGIAASEIFLPAKTEDLHNWPVIACDQYTSSPDYWEKVGQRVAQNGGISSLHMVLPEIYLFDSGNTPVASRIQEINETMKAYSKQGVLTKVGTGMVLLDRKTAYVESRKGLVLAIDLEEYDYRPGTGAKIRASEETVLDRIPPRLDIRRDADFETPHIILLMDDKDNAVLGPLEEAAAAGELDLLYDLELYENGGRLKGFFIDENRKTLLAGMAEALSKLKSFTDQGLLFAVGDGNHSLATAKTHWNNIKAGVADNHPARYALVEVINIHDPGLRFEPIHRLIFGITPNKLIKYLKTEYGDEDKVSASEAMSLENAMLMASTINEGVHPITLLSGDKAHVVTFNNPVHPFSAGTVQDFTDMLLKMQSDLYVDYIHGLDHLIELSDRGTGIILPGMTRDDFFDIIIRHGSLPRKTFSLGEADEKRFYMECKPIV